MKAKTKKAITGAAAVSLLAALAVGGTLAYLTDETERRANNFTFAGADGIDAQLTEPEWDGIIDYEYNDDGTITPVYEYIDADQDPDTPDVPVYGYTNGDKSKPVTDKDDIDNTTDRPRTDTSDPDYEPPVYGDEQAQNMLPGAQASKNPIITNTGSMTDEWVAAKITFVYAEGSADAGKPLSDEDMRKVTDVISIDYKTDTDDQWERIVGTESTVSQVFYYKEILKKDADAADVGVYGDATAPIFTTVSVSANATNGQIKALEEMGGFAIWIEGFAVQSDAAEDYTAFKTWGVNGVVFNHTPTAAEPADVSKPGIVPAE